MTAVVLPSAFAFLLVAVWVYALVDVVLTDEMLVRTMPKLVWVLVVVCLWVVGAVLWFAFGRPSRAVLDSRVPGPVGPEDEHGWTRYRDDDTPR